MKELLGSGATIILVSHNDQAIRDICKRAIWLNKGAASYGWGSKQCSGTICQVYQRRDFLMNITDEPERSLINLPLFITARFRTGSTMLWNLFRQLPEVRAYYEPLHDWIPGFIKYPIQPEKSHRFVKSSYFDEYKDVPAVASLHKIDFANHRLYLESEDSYPELHAYIQSLVESTPFGKTAVLQFNRIDFRLAWIKKNFTNARLLHLTRNPRDQWYSTMAPYNNIDLDHTIDLDAYSLATWARDLYKQFPFLAAPQIEHIYQRFYYLWKLSYLAGQRLSDLSLAYEDILAEPKKFNPDPELCRFVFRL